MSLSAEFVESILSHSSPDAWKRIADYLLSVFSKEFSSTHPEIEISQRDREISDLEMLIANSAWELWKDTGAIPKTSALLKEFWKRPFDRKAILILDGLSLRELPYFLKGAKERNYSIQSQISCAEIPSDTNHFAKAMGFKSRSGLSNNSEKSRFFEGAFTESVNFPWKDCVVLIQSKPDILFWHHYPDVLIHSYSNPNAGLDKLSQELFVKFQSEEFWDFIDVLLTGRKLIITSDHGYAATGFFQDIQNPEQREYLKTTFKGQRFSTDFSQTMFHIPPVDLTLNNGEEDVKMVLGRIKWKVSGGYATLNHGGLSLLEMFVPFLELEKINPKG